MSNSCKANCASCKDQSPKVRFSSIVPLEALGTNGAQAGIASHQRTNPSMRSKKCPMCHQFASQTSHCHLVGPHTHLLRNGSNKIEGAGLNKQQNWPTTNYPKCLSSQVKIQMVIYVYIIFLTVMVVERKKLINVLTYMLLDLLFVLLFKYFGRFLSDFQVCAADNYASNLFLGFPCTSNKNKLRKKCNDSILLP